MKIPMKYGWTRSTCWHIKEPRPDTYHLTLWRQPLHRWLMFKIYHWYDMRVYKMPGFKAIERWLMNQHKGDDLILPWSCNQDIRCYYLSKKAREILVVLQVTEEQYKAIRKDHDE